MNVDRNDAERRQNAAATSISESDGGVLDDDFMDHQYGRRIEADRSWTVYHVFTGIPADVDGEVMIGLSCQAATDSMLSLNGRNIERRKEQNRQSPHRRTAWW